MKLIRFTTLLAAVENGPNLPQDYYALSEDTLVVRGWQERMDSYH